MRGCSFTKNNKKNGPEHSLESEPTNSVKSYNEGINDWNTIEKLRWNNHKRSIIAQLDIMNSRRNKFCFLFSQMVVM